MFEAFLQAARASREMRLTWGHIEPVAVKLHPEASPRAIILASPYIPWDRLTDRRDLVKRWATAASAVPYTEEISQSVVDVLLQIASVSKLVPSIPVDVWSWLTKRPPLPPFCLGRRVGTRSRVVKVVRGLKDVEVLKSYLLIVWSEWDDLRDNSGFNKMCTSIRKDLSGIEMENHRTELVQRLDHVLGQLDQRSPDQRGRWLGRYDLWRIRRRYRKLKEVLVEVERRTSFQS